MRRKAKEPERRKSSAPTKKLFGRKKVEVNDGVNLEGRDVSVGRDVVGRDELTASDDIIQAEQYIEQQTNIRQTTIPWPRSVQIAIPVAAAAMVAIAIALFTTQTAGAKLDFEEGPDVLEKLEIKGSVEIVETGEPEWSVVGRFAAQLRSGDSFEDPAFAKVPSKQPDKIPVLKGIYRLAPGVTARGTITLWFNGSVACRISASEVDWTPFECDISEHADKEVGLRVEYVAVSGRAGGLLHPAILQDSDAVWVDNIEITEAESDTVAQVTIEPTITPSPSPTSSPTPTPTVAPSPTPTYTPTTTPTSIIPTGRLRLGLKKISKSCKNEREYFIRYSITAHGGTPPYTYHRDAVRVQIGGPTDRGITYEVRWREGNAAVGTFIVIDSAGQRAQDKFYEPGEDC